LTANPISLIKFIICISCAELIYFLFSSIIPRDIYNLFLTTVALATVIIFFSKYSSFSQFSFLAYILVVFCIVLSGVNAYFIINNFAWVGTLTKYVLYTLLLFSIRKVEFNNNTIFIFLVFVSLLLLYFTFILGWGLGNTQILNGRLRFQGLTYTSSIYSMFTGLTVIVLFHLGANSKYFNLSNSKKIITWLSFIFAFTACYLSGSRQPFYGLIMSFFIILYLNAHLFYKILVVFVISFILFLYKEQLFNAVNIISHIYNSNSMLQNMAGYVDGSTYSRIRYFDYGLYFLYQHDLQLYGSGLNSFPDIFLSLTGSERPATHNIILTILMNFGFVGLFVFIFFIVAAIFKSRKNTTRTLLILYLLCGVSLNNPDYFVSFSVFYLVFFSVVRNERK